MWVLRTDSGQIVRITDQSLPMSHMLGDLCLLDGAQIITF